MSLAKALHLLAACTLALFALGVSARAMDDLQVQNTPLEKIELLPLDGPHAWLTQAVELPQENDCRYDGHASDGLLGGLNRFGYVGGNPLSWSDPMGLAVELRCRPADIAGGLVNHCWLKTDTIEAGMNEQATCSRAGNDASGWPFQRVVVSDHRCDKPTIITPLPKVNETCVNNELQIGKPLGRFAPPANSCQTFTQDVIEKCSPKTYPRSPWR